MELFKKRFLTSFLLISLIYLIYNYELFLVFTLLILGVFSNIEFFNLTKKIINKNIIKKSIQLLYLIDYIIPLYNLMIMYDLGCCGYLYF